MLKDFKTKRLFAFILDMTLISILVIAISGSALNIYKDKYNEVAEEYSESYEAIQEEVIDGKITLKEFESKMNPYIYKLYKYRIVEHVSYLVLYFLYFVVFAYFTGGQTLGKKLMKLKIVKNNDEESNPSFLQLILRSILNGNDLYNGVNILVLINVILVLTIPSKYFTTTFMISSYIGYIIEIVFIAMILFKKDGRSLNDNIAKTKVIELK